MVSKCWVGEMGKGRGEQLEAWILIGTHMHEKLTSPETSVGWFIVIASQGDPHHLYTQPPITIWVYEHAVDAIFNEHVII